MYYICRNDNNLHDTLKCVPFLHGNPRTAFVHKSDEEKRSSGNGGTHGRETEWKLTIIQTFRRWYLLWGAMKGLPLLVSVSYGALENVINGMRLLTQEVLLWNKAAETDLLSLLLQGQDADNGHNEGGTVFNYSHFFLDMTDWWKHLIASLVESQGVCEWRRSNWDSSRWDIHRGLKKLHSLSQIRPVHQKYVRIIANHIPYLRILWWYYKTGFRIELTCWGSK